MLSSLVPWLFILLVRPWNYVVISIMLQKSLMITLTPGCMVLSCSCTRVHNFSYKLYCLSDHGGLWGVLEQSRGKNRPCFCNTESSGIIQHTVIYTSGGPRCRHSSVCEHVRRIVSTDSVQLTHIEAVSILMEFRNATFPKGRTQTNTGLGIQFLA